MEVSATASPAAAPGPGAGVPGAPLLRAAGVSKTFAGTTVLRSVELELRPGEVRGLVGENGSGKSTLIKILAGVYDPDPGARIRVGDLDVELPMTPARSRALGLSFVHQDLALEASLSVAENFRIDRLSDGSGWRLRPRAEARAVRETLLSYGLDLDPRVGVARLNQVERAMLAIVRAVERMRQVGADGSSTVRGCVLVLDEPTVFLPQRDRATLFELVRRLTDAGNAVLFVSHDLDECLQGCDRITVLRDGRLQGTVDSAAVGRPDIVRMMIGQDLEAGQHRGAADGGRGPAVLSVRDASGPVVTGLSFDVAAGEVVGVTGLLGSGFDEVPYLLGGAVRTAAGQVTVRSRAFPLARYRAVDAVAAGVALVPGDRARDGSVGSMSVQDNISAQVLPRYRRRGRIDWRRLRRDSARLLEDYDVRPRRLDARYATLSGGNQQKVMLAKWLQTGPTVLLLHEPTQGVDIGAREQIYEIVRRGAAEGAAVVCASADQEQLAILCDRVLVVRAGRVTAELRGAEVTKNAIARECLRVDTSLQEGVTRVRDRDDAA